MEAALVAKAFLDCCSPAVGCLFTSSKVGKRLRLKHRLIPPLKVAFSRSSASAVATSCLAAPIQYPLGYPANEPEQCLWGVCEAKDLEKQWVSREGRRGYKQKRQTSKFHPAFIHSLSGLTSNGQELRGVVGRKQFFRDNNFLSFRNNYHHHTCYCHDLLPKDCRVFIGTFGLET